MKAQMKFQKILSLVTLLVGALCFVFALCFFSGNLSDLMFYKSDNLGRTNKPYAEVSDIFINNGQAFVAALVVLGIVYICVAAFLYITATNSRRNYYITNYIAVGLAIGVSAIVALFVIIFISILLSQFLAIGIDTSNTSNDIGLLYSRLESQGAPTVSNSTLMFILGYIVAMIALANSVVWALNLVWKIKLMKGEKALLEGNFSKEAA